jgi:myo-inositol-1-phosphate synthase
VIDSVRFLKVAHRLGMKGPILGPSAFYQKTPPIALPFEEAKKMCDELAAVTIFDDGAKVDTSLWEGID